MVSLNEYELREGSDLTISFYANKARSVFSSDELALGYFSFYKCTSLI